MARFLRQHVSWRTVLLIACESALIIGLVLLTARVRLGYDAAWEWVAGQGGWLKACLFALVCQLCLYYADLYDLRIVKDRRELFVRAMRALGATSLILAFLYLWFPDPIRGRFVFFLSASLAIVVVIGWRVAVVWFYGRAGPRERLLLVGTGQALIELARELHDRREELGVDIVGFVDPDPAAVGRVVVGSGVIGAIEDIPALVRDHSVDRVVVSLADARGKLPMAKLLEMRLNDGVRFDHLASVYEEYTGKIAVENLRPSWLIFSEGFRKSRWQTAAKRSADVLASAIGLLPALPVMALVALAIKLVSPGPVLYHQQRVGEHGRVFTLHKFRSMRPDAEASTGAVWATNGDSRVTPVGRFLRRSRLDELPQLWNVLVGDMSFVGPRPERPEFIAELTRQIPFYGQRHTVKPGLTGWAQVRYSYSASVEDTILKLQYDLFYIKNMSLALDVFVILETIKTILVRRGS